MAEIRAISQIADKYARVTPMRADDYAAGVKNPRRSWATSAKNAKDAFKAGVTEAISKGRFEKGVARAGDEKWLRGAVEKGVARFGPGVSLAKDDYQKGFAPFADAIRSVKLPPRYAKRDPRNLARVKAIADALGAKKESLLGSSV